MINVLSDRPRIINSTHEASHMYVLKTQKKKKYIKSVLEKLNEIKLNTCRMKSNRMVLERRRSSKKMSAVGGAGVKEDDTLKPRSLKDKSVPDLSVLKSSGGSGGERTAGFRNRLGVD